MMVKWSSAVSLSAAFFWVMGPFFRKIRSITRRLHGCEARAVDYCHLGGTVNRPFGDEGVNL
jgi:hypothetical protein